jgi:hypothetical protein
MPRKTHFIKIIGIFHFIHSPILILFPYFVDRPDLDVIYINYFLLIIFSYTFTNGECPITYATKMILDKNYIDGDSLEYYPEMLAICPIESYIRYYVTTMTCLYIGSLLYVIARSTVPPLILPFSMVCIYFISIRSKQLIEKNVFYTIQIITRFGLFFIIFTNLIKLQLFCILPLKLLRWSAS